MVVTPPHEPRTGQGGGFRDADHLKGQISIHRYPFGFSRRVNSSASASITSGLGEILIAFSGSFKPCPVSVQTRRSPFLKKPFLDNFKTPAMEAAEAGSQKYPSFSATQR